jgi:hypothetical protein
MNAKYAEKPNPNPNEAIKPFVENWTLLGKQTQFFCGQLWIFTPKTQKWRSKS